MANSSPTSSPTPSQFIQALLTAKQAADRLAVSPRTLWTLTSQNRVRCVRIGRAVRYDPRDIEAFIVAAKKGGGA